MATIKPVIQSAKRFHKVGEGLFARIEAVLNSAQELNAVADGIRGIPGTLDGDLFCVYSGNRTKDEKYEALKRLANKEFSKPFPSQVRKAYGSQITEILYERAENHDKFIKQELNDCVMSAIVLANRELGDSRIPFKNYNVIRPFIKLFRKTLMEDILDPKWWQNKNKRSLDAILQELEKGVNKNDKRGKDLEEIIENKRIKDAVLQVGKDYVDSYVEVLLKGDLMEIVEESNLSQEEKAIMIAQCHGERLKDIAKKLKLNYNTIRSKNHRIKIKLNNMRKEYPK